MKAKRRLRFIGAFTAIFCAAASFSMPMSSYAAVLSPEITAIVAVGEDFDSSALGDFDIKYTYSGLFNGFAADMTLAQAVELSKLAGVDAVYQSSTRKTVSQSADNDSNSDAIFPRDLIESELRGEGTVAAVLDSSFDAYHEMFTLEDGLATALSEEDISGYAASGLLSIANSLQYYETDAYVSEKVPFAYDYADSDPDVYNSDEHGTHVAGIIGANNLSQSPDGFDGVAPDCQLLLMKVSSDSSGYIDDSAVLAALCDAVTLGADVINMSFGESSALTSMYLDSVDFSGIIADAVQNGIYVFAAAGNEGRFGDGTSYDAPPVFAQDNGTVGLPANLGDCVSVASADYKYPVYSDYFVTSDNEKIIFSEDSNGGFTDKFAGKSLDLVSVPGIGGQEDYDGIDVSGKIALISRGEITFSDKLSYAAEAGAVGAVIYDNIANGDPFTMQVEEGQLPSVSISNEDGILLISAGKVTLHSGTPVSYENKNAGMSSFSSWGPTPSLTLKPDITAWGGNIYSCVPDNRYTVMSGTSMASPLCSAYALLLRESGFADAHDAGTALMNTARPMIEKDSGTEYSPRVQGAGICDIDAALRAGLLITGDTGKGKVELGDGLQSSFKFTLTAENITDADITAKISGSILTDDYYYVNGSAVSSETPLALSSSTLRINGGVNVNRSSAKASYSEITVPAGESVSFTVSVKLSADEFSSLCKAFEYGFYIEGFVYLDCDDTEYSVPFMGYHGDWDSLAVFSHDDSFFGIVLSSFYSDGADIYTYPLGSSIFAEDESIDPSLIAISPNRDGVGDYIGFELALLRTITSFEAEITNAAGDSVYIMTTDFPLSKAYDDGSGSLNMYDVYDLWDGRDMDNSDYTYPDGLYTLTLRAYTEDAEIPQTASYTFRIDTQKPALDDWRIVEEDGKTILELDVSDNLGIMYAELYSDNDAALTVKFDLKPSEANTKTLRANITDLENNGYFYLDIMDFAANQTTLRIDINAEN